MKSKIEKLERVKVNQLKGMMGEVAPQWVAKELNKIIDHLNSQDQKEECKHNFDLNNRCTKCGVRGVRDMVAELQDTPEQTESDVQEWEKKWEGFFLYVTNDKNWADGRPEWKGNVYITLYNAMKDFIKQLLEEREREVLEMIYRKQDCFLHLGDFERWLEREYPELEDIDLSDSES